MTTDEMLKMFGIAPKATPVPASTMPGNRRSVLKGASTPESAPNTTDRVVGENAILQDKWDLNQGERLRRTSVCAKRESLSATTMGDFFAACYLQAPQPTEACSDATKLDFINALLDSPDHQALRQTTQGNRIAADAAAERIAVNFCQMRKEQQQKQQPKDEAKRKLRQRIDEAVAVNKAIREATDEIDKLNEIASVIGIGSEPGANKGLDTERVAKAFSAVQNSRMIKEVCERAGRFIRFAMGKQKRKLIHGYDDIVGVTVDDDIRKLLASELIRLDDPDLEDEAMIRITQKQAMARQHQGVEKIGKGPIVVCVDESSSMEADGKIFDAKAFALAMARVARHQKRWCCLVGWASARQGTRVVLPPNKWDDAKLLEWIGHFFEGGTELDVPCSTLPFEWWSEIKTPIGVTDIVLITDGAVHSPAHIVEPFLAWKKVSKAKMTGIVLGHFRTELKRVCDEVHHVERIGTDVAVIEQCLSI